MLPFDNAGKLFVSKVICLRNKTENNIINDIILADICYSTNICQFSNSFPSINYHS